MKKIIALVLVVCMLCISFVACAKPEAPEADAPAVEKPAEDASVDEKPAEAETEASGEPIKVGMITMLTGASAEAGKNNERSARLVIDKVNAEGGINGRPIELIIYDDEEVPETAAKCITRLVDADNVVAIVGSNLSANALASVDITEKAGVLHLVGGTSPLLTNQGYQYLYRAVAPSSVVDPTWIDMMCTDMNVKNVAIMSIENEYGQSGREIILENLKNYSDVNVVADETFQVTDTDFTAQITKVLKSNPDGIILYSITTNACMVIKQLRRMGYTGHIYGDISLLQADILNIVGSDADGIIAGATYVVPASPDLATSPEQQAMLQEYLDTYGEMPLYDTAFRFYDATSLVVEALKNAENVDDRESVAEAFRKINGYKGIGGVFDYTVGTGEGLNTAGKFMIKDGTIMAFDKNTVDG